MSLRLNGSTSGYTELDAGAVAGNNTIKMPTANGNAYQVLRNGATAGTTEFADKIVSGTAQASTSGTSVTSIDFTGIPSWVKRVTVLARGLSTNGSSSVQIQIGATSFLTSGYSGAISYGATVANNSTGLIIHSNISAATFADVVATIYNIFGNTWVSQGTALASGNAGSISAGSAALSGTLDRIRITTVNGTDTFDAGTINILYE